MKIALLGYGKMGQAVEQIALKRGHQIVGVEEADVCIDFSHPDAVLEHIGQACEHKKDIVIGTTGWLDHLEAAKNLIEASGIGAFFSPNFSIGTHLFAKLVHEAKGLFGKLGYQAAGFEIHHSEKVDRPSGTAMMLEIPEFASVRCGWVPGTHTVMFDSPSDTVELTIRARNREGWAMGAVMAAEWVKGKTGFFGMKEMLE